MYTKPSYHFVYPTTVRGGMRSVYVWRSETVSQINSKRPAVYGVGRMDGRLRRLGGELRDRQKHETHPTNKTAWIRRKELYIII